MAHPLQEYFKIEQADTIVPAVRKLSIDFAKAIDNTNQIAQHKKDKYHEISTAKALVQSVLLDIEQLKDFMILKEESNEPKIKPALPQGFPKKMLARKRGRPRKRR